MNCPTCNVHIDEHPASQCLNEWVATDVMGYKALLGMEENAKNFPYIRKIRNPHVKCVWINDDGVRMACEECGDMPEYSTSIAAAWQVREVLHRKGISIGLIDCRLETNTDCKWAYEIYTYDNPDAVMDGVQFGTYHYELDGGAKAAPLAICRAAIKATKESE